MNGSVVPAVLGFGEARTPQPDLFESRIRMTVRYADPSAWITAAAVAHALSKSRDQWMYSEHTIGLVVVSDQGPTSTMEEVNAATSVGYASPLRYAAASPGSLAGVACIAFGFRGPTLNFTMLPDDGVPVAITLCSSWLARRVARYMVLATYRGVDLKSGFSRAVLLAHPEHCGESGDLLNQSVSSWLTQIGD